MIPASLYVYIYLIIVTIITISYLPKHLKTILIRTPQKQKQETLSALFLTLFMILFVGFRPISGDFGDMPGYAYAMIDHRFEYVDKTWSNNFVFVTMMSFLSSIGANEHVPIILLAFINFGATFFAMKRLFPNDVLLAMLVFFAAFSTFGAATNGLKAGCAMALFLVALSYRNDKKLFFLFLFLSYGFHHSMQLPVVASGICYFYKKTKNYMFFWFLCLLLSALHVQYFMNYFSGITDDQGASYLTSPQDSSNYTGKVGFRLDFIIYSSIPIIIGYIAIIMKRIRSSMFQFLFNVYLLTNGIWLLCMYAQFTNRIAYLSWGMIPVLILYPFIHCNWGKDKYNVLFYVVMGHLSFTLFMEFIFYS